MSSNLPTIQILKYEDYAKAKDWQGAFQSLVSTLNLFINPVYNILNGGIGYNNVSAPKIFTRTITADGTNSFTFTNPTTVDPSAVIVGNVWTGIRSTHPSGNVQAFWHVSGNSIIVDSITGLTVGTNYTITLLIF